MNGSIKGTWVIDTNLQVPEALLAPPPSTGERHNLSLTASNGPIMADVIFVSGKPDRASILLTTTNGKINFNVVCENSQERSDYIFSSDFTPFAKATQFDQSAVQSRVEDNEWRYPRATAALIHRADQAPHDQW
jgi:hypothetical protein